MGLLEYIVSDVGRIFSFFPFQVAEGDLVLYRLKHGSRGNFQAEGVCHGNFWGMVGRGQISVESVDFAKSSSSAFHNVANHSVCEYSCCMVVRVPFRWQSDWHRTRDGK